jgi:hypothetical protein
MAAIYAMRPPAPERPPEGIQHAIVATRRQADVVRLAYGRLRSNGCAEAEISFEAPGLPAHRNPHARPEHACDVFQTAGSAVTYQPPPAEILDHSFAKAPDFGAWEYSIDNDIEGLGTQPCIGSPRFHECNDLIALVPYLNEAACRAANAFERSPIPPSALIPWPNSDGIANLRGYVGQVLGQMAITGLFCGRVARCFGLQRAWLGTEADQVQFGRPFYVYFRLLAAR